MDHVALDPEVVPDALGDRVKRLTRLEVEADDVALSLLILKRDNHILDVPPSVGRERLREDEERLGECLNTELSPTLRGLLDLGPQMSGAGDLERSRTGNERLVLERVLDGAETVAEAVVDLGDGVRVGTLDKERDRLGRLDVLNEGELLLAKRVLVNEAGVAEDIGCELIDRVLRGAATAELETRRGKNKRSVPHAPQR